MSAARLPTFLVIGAAKAGTTSLHHYLRQHPEVHLPAVKEVNYYWDGAAAHGREQPCDLEQYAEVFAGAGDAVAVGEISPRYLTAATAAERIHRDLPDVKLVVSLRNPIERAYSDYLGRVRILRETRDVEHAIRPGEQCVEWGRYARQLERFLVHFRREQLHVMLYDDFAVDPDAALRDLFDFLGVDPEVPIDTTVRHNRAAAPRSPVANRVLWKAVVAGQRLVPRARRGSGAAARILARTYRPAAPMTAHLRNDLLDFYADDIDDTASLIGRDLSSWRT